MAGEKFGGSREEDGEGPAENRETRQEQNVRSVPLSEYSCLSVLKFLSYRHISFGILHYPDTIETYLTIEGGIRPINHNLGPVGRVGPERGTCDFERDPLGGKSIRHHSDLISYSPIDTLFDVNSSSVAAVTATVCSNSSLNSRSHCRRRFVGCASSHRSLSSTTYTNLSTGYTGIIPIRNFVRFGSGVGPDTPRERSRPTGKERSSVGRLSAPCYSIGLEQRSLSRIYF